MDALFEIQGDPEVLRFTYCAASRDDTARHLESHAARFEEDGFAPWTVVRRGDQRIIGWGGLNRDPQAPHWGTEVAYFFHPSCWGRGFATELVNLRTSQLAVEASFIALDATLETRSSLVQLLGR